MLLCLRSQVEDVLFCNLSNFDLIYTKIRQIPHHQTNLICSTKSTICVLVILYLCSIYLDVDMNFRKLGRLKLGMFLIKDPYICSITLREFMYLAENMEKFKVLVQLTPISTND